MESNQTRTLLISIGCGLFAMFLLWSWSVEQQKTMNRKFGTFARVVVASEDIAEMETIDESKLKFTEHPADFLQPEAISDVENAVGQVAAVPIKAGEQILQTKLLLPGPETGLSMEVSPGRRAITLPIDDMRGVSRLLRPGDRIDIVAALDYGKGPDAKREVRTILQDVVVLATGLNVVNKIPRRFELDGNGKTINRINLNASTNFTTITIEGKPDEVQQLVYILATAPGSLFTVLRNPSDRAQAPTRITTIEDVLGKPNLVRAPAQAGAPLGSLPGLGSSGPSIVPSMPPSGLQQPPRQPQRNGPFEEL
jgi:pilus assembly protein CpaB